ncbi:nucleoid occlusion protein [Liquorilactobacillus mali]|uniref:Chromosome partitioning protein, DNA-binding protein n=1 Tax=Liquorilactobacillus mali KCTC 3596 = DSM 20444 TaxID=1046596 RepID=A0A0R2EES1_9LACO|nr:nucleoid occlusion protein [Liquorilactobacillus mali]KRN11084.1 chromosome partitioning protein, DNA-binding protein [Liquorilactobacillus mali KCTC 3596 = DSM 20444]QFQ75578.1 nucleoid occlusion protein [Liquorilactobacillus mali]
MAFSFWNKDKKPEVQTQSVREIELSQIVPNRFQPRKVFEEEKIVELANTIRDHGLLQPIIVREFQENKFEIIAGERRFRAVSLLQWNKIPAIVKKMTDTEAASLAVIENLQREGLTAIEEAKAYRELMKLNKLTQIELAKALGKSQSFVANKLRLLKLAPYVQRVIMQRKILERHGRSVLSLNDEKQVAIIKRVIDNQLTVKETEALVLKELEKEEKTTANNTIKKPRRNKALHDTRIAVNTIKKSVKLIKENGMKVKTHEEDVPGFHRIVIDIPVDKEQQDNK